MKRKLNLQFFADEADVDTSAGINVGGEEPEVAEPTGVEEGSEPEAEAETETMEETEPKARDFDRDAIAAAARRKAEAEAAAEQKRRDAEFARRFGNYAHPVTGKPISSEAEYLDAIDAQERLKSEKELRDKGIDPAMIDNLVKNNPAVIEANKYIEQAKEAEAMAQINKHVAELSELDPSIKTLEDVPPEVINKSIETGMSLTDAYKVVNYGKMTSQKAEAIRQGAINQVKGKSHLNPMNGVAVNDNSVEIPADLKGLWEEAFPDKTWEERKKLYNEQLK